jgi:pilus assembly protein Flp/PilA
MNSTTILLTQVKDESVKGRAMFRLIRDRSGVTAIEYALIASLVAVAAMAAFSLVGTNLSSTFSNVAGCL